MNLVTPEDVYDRVSVSVDYIDIARAQAVIETPAGLDLSDADVVAGLLPADLASLRSAIIWQVAYLDDHPEVLTQATNIASASTNGSSLTFREGDGIVAPLAQRCLDGLSWRRASFGVQTLRPNRREYEVRPDPWVKIR